MKALFVRKAIDLVEMKVLIKEARDDGEKETGYEVTREIEMSPATFREFKDDLLKDQTWIKSTDGGLNKYGKVRCIRVKSRTSKESILVNPEGYTYPRYIAIEE
ncbi:hypothetical protein [Clostridium grantii]|uniref:Uncharacterized protein n=1 Tax=Clostridium grantii DSM 8605 TaxID=1121316 RepID=A0A1M5U7Z5_9CLOT|nr:hypothetical protein [Clostridium grantii]SHH59079.1 hypothetical protein SAMN02745207_01630 [Clostridium grantii DSM 8605]